MITSLSINADGKVFAGTDVGGLYSTEDAGLSWTPRNSGLRNYDIITPVLQDHIESSVLYVGTRGGFYKSIDHGATWEPRWQGLPGPKSSAISAPVAALAASSKIPGRLYMGFGYRPDWNKDYEIISQGHNGAFYVSNNSGESWSSISRIAENTPFRHIIESPGPENFIYAATGQGVFASSDFGKNWGKLLAGDARNLYCNPAQPNQIFVTMGSQGVLVTEDGGKNWNPLNKGLPTGRDNNFSIITGKDCAGLHLFLLNSTWSGGGGLYTLNFANSSTWTPLTKWSGIEGNVHQSWLKGSRRINAIALNPANCQQIFLGSSRYLYRSDDGGGTWEQLISQKTPTGNWTHRGINVFGQTRAIAIDPTNPNVLLVATTDHGLLRSEDKGVSWNASVTGMDFKDSIRDIVFSRTIPGRVYVINVKGRNKFGIARSDNHGKSWRQTDSDPPTDKELFCLLLTESPEEALLVAGLGGIYKTTNGGQAWSRADTTLPASTMVNSLATRSGTWSPVFAGTDKGIFTSSDTGTTWTKISGKDLGKVTSILVDQDNPKVIFAGTRTTRHKAGGVYKTSDGGNSWKLVLRNTMWVSSLLQPPSDGNVLFASTNDDNFHDESNGAGMFFSLDHGETWNGINDGLAVLRAYGMAISATAPYDLYLCSNGSGLYVMENISEANLRKTAPIVPTPQPTPPAHSP